MFPTFRCGLSTAIFAPGWVYEVLGPSRFQQQDLRFWTDLQPYLQSHSVVFPDGFFTSDNHIKKYQHQPSRSSYFNINCQELQPQFQAKGNDGRRRMPLIWKCVIPSKDNTVTIGYEHTMPSLTLLTDSGELAVQNATQQGFEDKTFTISRMDNKCKIRSTSEFSVLAVKCNSDAYDIRIISGDIKPKTSFQPKLMTYKDMCWKKSKHDKTFSLSCTLVLDRPPNCHATIVSYCSQLQKRPKHQPDPEIFLGYSYCSFFRISDLELPNPKYHGPCSVTFLCEHSSIDSNDHWSQNITLKYAENLRLP